MVYRGCVNSITRKGSRRKEDRERVKRTPNGKCASILKTLNFINQPQFLLNTLGAYIYIYIYIKTLSCTSSIRTLR